MFLMPLICLCLLPQGDIVLKVSDWLSERDTSEGVIMLVDMGSLTHLYKSLKPPDSW